MKNKSHTNSRRAFCKMSTIALSSTVFSKNITDLKTSKIPLGFDNFSIRALGWNAQKLLEYASKKRLNSILFSDLGVYDTFDKSYLLELSKEAKKQNITIHAGTGGICPTSNTFKTTYGSAVDHLRLLIRVAKDIGSSVARCYLGNMKDRKSDGGIRKHIDETIKVLKLVKKDALDAGVTIAVENHAGDMRSQELVNLIERAGPEYVGATLDSGNATWTFENPIQTLQNLAPFAVSSGIRDSMVWSSKKGVKVQWTAMGEGCVDLVTFISEWKKLCPELPMQLETISGFTKEFAIMEDDFWSPYSEISGNELSKFLRLARKGKEIMPFSYPKNSDRKEIQKNYQLAELEKSIKYCREVLGVGIN